jgi:hypothetical protein
MTEGACLIHNVCRAAGEAKAEEACLVCDPASALHEWTPALDAAACVSPAICVAGEPCDDANPCTQGDFCQAGVCSGDPVACDDADLCTDDACDPSTGVCASAPTVTSCEDGSSCTIDTCDPDAGCVHIPLESPCCIGLSSVCDDQDPCTVDVCDAATGGCSHQNGTDACDDGNACTESDGCAGGTCSGAPVTCDDHNPCTSDSCHKTAGCLYQALGSGACDDGLACSVNDTCSGGQCAGDTSGCTCVPSFAPDAAKLTSLQIGAGGHPDEALDLDGDPATCAPSSDCSAGMHNALSVLASMANDKLAKAVAEGKFSLVTEFQVDSPGSWTVALYTAELDSSNPGCDIQSQTCAWRVDPDMLDAGTCKAVVQLPATVVGTKLTAGGKGTTFPLSIPLSAGGSLDLVLYDVLLQATLTLTSGQVTGLTGVLGGAVPKSALIAAIDALPDDALPLPKDTVKGLLDTLVENDLDVNADGAPDAASIGLKLVGIDATIAGVAAK